MDTQLIQMCDRGILGSFDVNRINIETYYFKITNLFDVPANNLETSRKHSLIRIKKLHKPLDQ